ncbi:MAG TPA: hypothetical protein VFN10_10150 [Thermoanaerobaculia bacterium]|nr:hypothetical protein [Thermoanaerobaculia bacterium]
MNDHELSASLQALPRAKASSRFSSDVLRRIRNDEAQQPRFALWFGGWRAATALALTLFLLVAVQASLNLREQHRLAALRAEHQRIEADLAAVKKLASDADPVVVLENDDTRVVVELPDAPAASLASSRIID